VANTIQILTAAVSSSLDSFRDHLPNSLQPYVSPAIQRIQAVWLLIPSKPHPTHPLSYQSLIENPEYTSAALVSLLIIGVVTMSGWRSRLLGAGGFSPFAATEYPPQVTEEDYSYITQEDGDEPLRDNHVNLDARNPSAKDDIIIVRYKGVVHPLHFKAYSIEDRKLTIRHVRERLAKAIGVDDPHRIRLVYKGDILKDSFTCFQYKLGRGAELMADTPVLSSDEENSDGEDVSPDQEGPTKRKKNRKRKPKKKSPNNTGSSTPNLAPRVPPAGASRSPSPGIRSPAVPKTAVQKLEEISSHFHSKLVPMCIQFLQNPPVEAAKVDFEHRKLAETIMGEVLLKLDAVETEGNPNARQRRKDLVTETQDMLNRLDGVTGSAS
jgi:hypothetical protein